MPEPIARRRVLGGGLVLAGALLAGGCRDEPEARARAGDDGAPNAGDLDLLVALGQVEHTLAGAFAALAEVRADDLDAGGLAAASADHADRHGEHARRLGEQLEAAGLDPLVVQATFPGMAVPGERDLAELPVAGLLGALARCEAAAAATGADAVGRITVAELRGVVAGIGAADAGLAQVLQLAIGGGVAALDQSDLVDGLLPLDRSYLAG